MEELEFRAGLMREVSPSEYLFRAGDSGRHMYVVRRGSIDILDSSMQGGPRLLRQVGPGEIFGEIALIEAVPRTADAQAGPQGAELMEIDHAHFVYLAVQQPAFGVIMMQMLSRKLRGAPARAAADGPAEPRAAERASRASRWTRLGEGIYHLMGEPGAGGCKVYLIRGSRRSVLVDAGLPSDFPDLERHLADLGLAPADIDMVLLTHEHMDHIGGTARLPRRTLVASHTRAANKIARGDDFVQMSDLFGLAPASFHVDVELQDDSVIDLGDCALRAIHTPGHVSGALCFYEPDRQLLFSADTLFAGGILGGIFASGSNSDYLWSLKRLQSLRIRQILPGHGRNSETPHEDIECGIRAAERLANDTRVLFDAMAHGESFRYIMRGTAAYAAKGRDDTPAA